jgi:hypothetical protein
MSTIIKKTSDLNDYIGFVVLSAPNNFPKVGPFSENSSANLDHAFNEIDAGMLLLQKKIKDSNQLNELRTLLEKSKKAYLDGDDIKGAHLLQDFQDIAFPSRFNDYKKRKNS